MIPIVVHVVATGKSNMNIPTSHLFTPPLPKASGQIIYWNQLNGASLGAAVKEAVLASQKPVVLLTADSSILARLWEELHFFDVPTQQLLHFPDRETLPYDHFSPHQDLISERLATLAALTTLEQGAILATVTTIMHYLPPKKYLDGHQFYLKLGDKLEIESLRQRLIESGYQAVSQVREHGEFAIRGSIIDLFAMGSEHPFRIDLFDTEIDSIRTFSPETQRSLETVTEIRLLPGKEFPMTEAAITHFREAFRSQFAGNPLKCPIYQDVSEGVAPPGIEYYLPLFYDTTSTLFDYLPQDTLFILIGEVMEKAEQFSQEIELRYQQGKHDILRPLLTPKQLFISKQLLQERLKPYSRIFINQAVQSQKYLSYSFPVELLPPLDIQPKQAEPLAALQTFLSTYTGRVLFCAETLGRREVLMQLFKKISLSPLIFSSWHEFLASQAPYGMIVAQLQAGCILTHANLAIIAEAQLYSQRVMQRRLRKKSIQDTNLLIRDLTELQINDLVVHTNHGIGRYLGLKTLKIAQQEAEFLNLEYQGGDKLYVPVASLHLINRYSGGDPATTSVNKLGNDQWQKTKRKAAEKIRDVAAELLDLYAKRAARPGHACQIPEEQYAAFASAFPFEETPDQLNAITQVFNDMTSDKPMDRVVCGDVGFGKTEVALRAAFLAVQNNKQVCMLVPTTLLAQQHLQTFQDRFADWPVQIEMLSRFRSSKDQKNILERMQAGSVDIVIGTHKLLQSDIQFKALGLVIIDEEHRFGVKQKEKLKSLRASVDILTLTATPIPRTLNMAMSGMRDLSIIATPPEKRLSVKTFVHEYQKQIIQEAIKREVMRGGQVYFLHNDISTINKKAEEIAELVQEARPVVAHGQMHERELERIMSQFYHRHYNVLVCSTIIESGIDVPTANTILINRADQFGIAQLHQLRGRVGRSHHQAYAYLLIPSAKHLSKDATKRLEAITSFDELGIGFTLATHDLEIRGAGELLGEEQSGEMHAVGFTLYMDMLSRAVSALKQGKEPNFEKSLLDQYADIDLHLTALIPENYIYDVQMRLNFYNRIANAKDDTELTDIQVELIDRFGLLPQPLKTLIAVTQLKQKANELGIIKIDANKKGGKIEFNSEPKVKPEIIIKLIQQKNSRYKLEGPTALSFTLIEHQDHERIKLIDDLLTELRG